MDKRPIGVFDSGMGGLTALRELRRLLPGEDLVYFGDTGRVPYGGRSRETITRYARQDVAFLRSFDLKAIVIACGTVTSNSLDLLRAENDLPLFGVVEPAAREAVAATRAKRVGVIATAASIRSGAYERIIASLDPGIRLWPKPCPLFVPLVENGRYAVGDKVVELVAEEYLAELRDAGVDTLVMGCTHYPLLTQVIAETMGPGVALVDAGAACARAVAAALARGGALSGETAGGARRYYVSDSTDDFAALASIFLRGPVTEPVEQVEIERYSPEPPLQGGKSRI